MTYAAILIGAYLLGGIPVGVLICRAYGVNIFEVGSGNIGATNVGRVLGWKAWVIVFPLDVLKGALPPLVASRVLLGPVGPLDVQCAAFVAGLAAVAGHCWSPFLRFKGGKGVATALGAGLGAAPLVALSSFALFGVVLATTRYMAIASICGVSATLLFGVVFKGQSLQLMPFYALLSISVAVRHVKNIKRLLAGTEPKFGKKKPAESPNPANLAAAEERLEDKPSEPGPNRGPDHGGACDEPTLTFSEHPGADELN